ncbi:MAG: deiodinase [bacterium]|nr:deiodinase [bacterium]
MVEDPVTLEERLDLAPLPTVVDGMDDRVNKSYGAWPERLYLIAKGGQVAYRGGPGPFEFDPDGLVEAIEALR